MVDDIAPGSGYAELRQSAAALQERLAKGLSAALLDTWPAPRTTATKPAQQPPPGTRSTGMAGVFQPSVEPARAERPFVEQPFEQALEHRRSETLVDERAAVHRPAAVATTDDPAMTPIFHALSRGGWTNRQPEQHPTQQAGQSTQQAPRQSGHAPAEPAAQQPSGPVAAGTEADPAAEFRRDPLSAPIPTQVPPRHAPMAQVRPLHPIPAGRHRRGDRGPVTESAWTR